MELLNVHYQRSVESKHRCNTVLYQQYVHPYYNENYFANERTNQKQGNTADFHNSPIGCKQNKLPKT
jgi:hypothetical protein